MSVPRQLQAQAFHAQAATLLIVPAFINNLGRWFRSLLHGCCGHPMAIPSAVIASGLPAVLNVPAAGGGIHAGPFKGASADSNDILSFGDVNACIVAYKADGTPIVLNTSIACPAQARPASPACVAVGGTSATTTITPAALPPLPSLPPLPLPSPPKPSTPTL
ncbi:hypothetical protein V8E36_008153, partial [Tilletia maclaganii]